MGQCVEEEYFIDVDLSENEKESVILIFRQRGSTVKMVNSFTGTEARKFFDILNGNMKMGERSDGMFE
jgi:hypothetical protein